MRLKSGECLGDFIKFEKFEHYNIYIAQHSSDVELPSYSHENSYFSFLIKGSYSEENNFE